MRKVAQARAERRPWGEAEVKAFIEAIKGDRLFGVMLLTLAAGRPAEGCGIRWEEVVVDELGRPFEADMRKVRLYDALHACLSWMANKVGSDKLGELLAGAA